MVTSISFPLKEKKKVRLSRKNNNNNPQNLAVYDCDDVISTSRVFLAKIPDILASGDPGTIGGLRSGITVKIVVG